MVKGDLIVEQTDRILTRSRARTSTWNATVGSMNCSHLYPEDPDRYTIIPATLKIIKVLVEELLSAGGPTSGVEAAAAQAEAEGGSDDEEWEDEPGGFVDLGLGATKQELMAYGEDSPLATRQRDDETQAYLLEFFRLIAQKPVFGEIFAALTPSEQEKLRAYG